MNFCKNMLTKDGKVSSKRVVTLVCLVFMLMGYTANLFWDCTIDSNLFDSLQWIVMAGLGFTASEQFSTNGKGKSSTPITHEYDVGEAEDV
jgi:hypothetical protein